MSEEAAREAAVRRFGDVERAAAVCTGTDGRRARGALARVLDIDQDLTCVVRAMRRSPGFTLAAIATLTLGCEANTAVFSLLNALFVHPLDATRADELVRVYTSQAHAPRHDMDRFGASSYAARVEARAVLDNTPEPGRR